MNFEEHIRHFCFITSKKGRKQLKQGKKKLHCLRQKYRQKTPVPELVRPIP